MGLEAGDAALEQGLSQPQSSDAPADNSITPEPSSQPNAPEPQVAQATDGQPSIAELEKLGKIKFEGREWTAQELKSAMMMQQDYSRKTAEIAQERKYHENLEADLESVRANPQLVGQFKALYPQKFHQYLKYADSQTQSTGHQQSAVPQEVLTKLEELTAFKTNFEVKNLEAEVDQAYSKLSEKYPMADEVSVTARAERALKQGAQLRDAEGKLNVSELEKIFKAEHERIKQVVDTHYKTQFEQQKAASSKARDVAGGGGVPGQSPERMTFDQATQKAIKDYSARH